MVKGFVVLDLRLPSRWALFLDTIGLEGIVPSPPGKPAIHVKMSTLLAACTAGPPAPHRSCAPRMLRQIADADRSNSGERDRVIILDGAAADADGANQNALLVDDGQTAGECNKSVV